MDISHWELLTLASRWLLYVAIAGAIGGACSLYLTRAVTELQRPVWKYAFIATSLTLITAVIHFMVRTGAAMEEGVSGMFDPDMLAFMWKSAIGDALAIRILGAICLLIALTGYRLTNRNPEGSLSNRNLPEITFGIAGIGLLAYSFTEAGHAVSQPEFYQAVLIIHVALTAWWMGSLVPLWLLCKCSNYQDAHTVLQRFGELAIAAVVVLVTAGMYMSFQLTQWNDLTSQSYGSLLLIKILLVGLILFLAAGHKFVLVPKIITTQNTSNLRASLWIEKLIGAAIFIVTTIITTIVGPAH